MKRIVVLGAAIMIVFSLAACKGGESKDSQSNLSNNMAYYTPEYTDLGLPEGCFVTAVCFDGEKIYFAGQQFAKKTQVYQVSIYQFIISSRKVEMLADNISLGDDSICHIQNMGIGSDGTIWVWETRTSFQFDLPDHFDIEADNRWNYASVSDSRVLLRQIDSGGNELYCTDMTGKLEEDIYNISIDVDGNCYIPYSGKLAVLDRDGNSLFAIENTMFTSNTPPVRLTNDRMGVLYETIAPDGLTSTFKVQEIDLDAKSRGTEYELSAVGMIGNCTVHDGGGKYLFCYVEGGDALYGWNTETGKVENILSWTSSNINYFSVEYCTVMNNGCVLAMLQTSDLMGEANTAKLAVLTETDAASLPERTVLTYATLNLQEDERELIIKFNNSQQKYQVEIHDYSIYETPGNFDAGFKLLTTEILAGKVPDIINTSNLPITQYAASGLLEDLWPYIDNDPELRRDQLMTHVLECDEIGGKLYEIFDSFDIRTIIGAQAVVGDRMSWTLADLQTAKESASDGCEVFHPFYTKENVLREIMRFNQEKYVDWDSGKCDFDSEDFRNILEFCNSLPSSSGIDSVSHDEMYRAIKTRNQLLVPAIFYKVSDIKAVSDQIGEEISFVGYPTMDGSIGSRFCGSFYRMAITTECVDKEGAWSLVRELLMPDTQTRLTRFYRFPINKSAFENDVAKRDVTQEDYDRLMKLYQSIDMMYRPDSNLDTIVREVAGTYFAGDKSLDETVELIQRRVTLYVNEQK